MYRRWRSGSNWIRETEGPFVEISTYEYRPGGFSHKGLTFHADLVTFLRQEFPSSVSVVQEPPPPNHFENLTINVVNVASLVFMWAAVFFLSVLISGSLSLAILRRLRIPVLVKRLCFVAINAIVATPVPFSAAFIFVVYLPHVFAFPWNNFDYYDRIFDVAMWSFPLSVSLCVLLAFRLITPDKSGLRPKPNNGGATG